MLEVNKIYNMDCLEGLKLLDDNSIDSIVTDPPYGIEFMGKEWDSFSSNTNSALGGQSPANINSNNKAFKTRGKPISGWCEKDKQAKYAFQDFCYEWATECLRILKPGGFLLSFGGTRTYHRMACAIEDAGFEIRDQIQWIYGSGFPKSMDISKAIDKKFGAEREIIGKRIHPTLKNQPNVKSNAYHVETLDSDENMESWDITAPTTDKAQQWDGWGTALKPANEPIVVARKPISEKTVADNVLKWGTGGINIDSCRIETEDKLSFGSRQIGDGIKYGKCIPTTEGIQNPQGRFPANVIFDEEAGRLLDEQSGISKSTKGNPRKADIKNQTRLNNSQEVQVNCEYNDSGGASRFFYCAKASKKERGVGNNHPTVKPLSLIKYLVTLVTPPQGISCDPFEGSGTHAKACKELGFDYIGFEKETTYCEIAENRL